ncbi:Tol-Pal system beta propeller repeat protein TolB [Haliangium ochraceum]|nr:Tol-Pal system beta propeller repeat protein TolB [Haliangium ochraceum]
MALTLGPARSSAQQSGVVIELENPKRGLYPIAIPRSVAADAAQAEEAQKVMDFDLAVSGWFEVLDPRSFLADLRTEGLGIQPQKWKDVGAFGVIKHRISRSGNQYTFEGRLYEVEKGSAAVLIKTYRGGDLRALVHNFCNDVVEHYTGERGFFGSKMAFVTRGSGGKQVMAMDFDGHGVRSLTRNSSLNILPSWSPDGSKVAFTSYMRNNPDLYVVGAGGGRPNRISKQSGMNTGASWSPDGSKIAVTLSKDGNPEIYIISASSGAILQRLTNDRAIDTSPAWSPDGREIAFVSDRHGGPQIFVMSAAGGSPRRVSRNGSYNTTPVWSPRKDKRMLAYTTRDGGTFDIVTLDLGTGDMVRITQGQGSNEEPSFSPNGRAIAFASERREGAGIYIANADGSGTQRRVYSGVATSIDWGPAPRGQ